jgi:hypothetical protein|tara:strand:- start:634 stop:825 length:192 start_codon:yes stop_codon:yes gene_type:complete
MNIEITNNEVKDWLDTFDGNDEIVLLTAIANNEIKTEVMNDSIYAFSVGETEISKQCYKEMWR